MFLFFSFFFYTIFSPQRLSTNRYLRKLTLVSGNSFYFISFTEGKLCLHCYEWAKVFPGLIVSEVIEANISFHSFLNLGHNSRTVTKTTWDLCSEPQRWAKHSPRRSVFIKCLTEAFRQNRKSSEITWKVWEQNENRHSGLKHMHRAQKNGKDNENTKNGGVVRLNRI